MEAVKAQEITAREIFDSRGEPTLEVTVALADGSIGTARVPSGDPGESRPTRELRDGDPRRYRGRGVSRAVKAVVDTVAPALLGSSPGTLREADRLLRQLDSTPDASRLGANALWGASLAWGKALAAHAGLPLARFLGGETARHRPLLWVRAVAEPWEIFLLPVGCAGLEEAFRWCGEVLSRLEPSAPGEPEQDLARVTDAVESAGHAGRVRLALAPRGLFSGEGAPYRLPRVREPLPTEELLGYWESLARRFPLEELIDPLAPGDALGWGELAARLEVRLGARAPGPTDRCFHDAVLCPHHFATVTELLDSAQMIRESGTGVIFSSAPGETEDDALADLALAAGAGQLMLGPARGSEHLSKVNRLLALEEH